MLSSTLHPEKLSETHRFIENTFADIIDTSLLSLNTETNVAEFVLWLTAPSIEAATQTAYAVVCAALAPAWETLTLHIKEAA